MSEVRHAPSHGHRHAPPGQHEHEFEPVPGLPEPLPAHERLLWQGGPDWRRVAVEAYHVRKLAIYFGAILLARAGFVLADGGGAAKALIATLWLLPLVAFALGTLLALAWMTGRTAVYTITSRRVVMRIGIVLTVTFNIPFKRIAGAGLRVTHADVGDIPLQLAAGERIGWLHLWPHCRPWRLGRPEPMLRAVPQAQKVAAILAAAWSDAQRAAPAAAANTAADARPTAAPRQRELRAGGVTAPLAAAR